MLLPIILLITLLCYSVLVSQSFFYLIAMKNTTENLDAVSYIRIRKLLDKNFRARYSYVFYSCFASSTLLLITSGWQQPGWLFITSVFAWLGFIADALLMFKGNMPINQLINSWSEDQYPADWARHRERWLKVFALRQLSNITGFIFLLTGAVFG